MINCFREDYETGLIFSDEEDKDNFYSELKSAAESGWDFSTRWFIVNGTNKGTTWLCFKLALLNCTIRLLLFNSHIVLTAVLRIKVHKFIFENVHLWKLTQSQISLFLKTCNDNSIFNSSKLFEI